MLAPPPTPSDPVAAIVARLRAAGCVFAEAEADLIVATAPTRQDVADLVGRRVGGEPLEHVLGWAQFGGLRIAVDPGVFVPRRRTEFLVREAAALARQARRERLDRAPSVVVDLCCGSGALGAALVTALGQHPREQEEPVELYAADIDPAAVRCARRNVEPLGGRVLEGDLYRPLPATLRGRVDVLLANAPYVPTGAVGLLPREARIYESPVALDGGTDGLDVLRRLSEPAAQWLSPGGCLLVETSERQAPLFVDVVTRSGLIPRVAEDDELGATVVIATRPVRS